MSDRQRAEFEQLLSSLFDKISSSLGDLITSLDRAIPSATAASDSAKHIFAALRSEESLKTDELDSIDWFQRMTAAVAASPQGGKKVKALKRDLEITRASAGAVIGVWQALEDTRESLVSYQRHVEHYKVRFSPRRAGAARRADRRRARACSRRPESSAFTSLGMASASSRRSAASRPLWARCARRSTKRAGVRPEEELEGGAAGRRHTSCPGHECCTCPIEMLLEQVSLYLGPATTTCLT